MNEFFTLLWKMVKRTAIEIKYWGRSQLRGAYGKISQMAKL